MSALEDYFVLVIPHDSDPYNAILELPSRDSTKFYAALQVACKGVVGLPIEHVRVFTDFSGGRDYKYLDMFVNGDGHILRPALPLNVRATAIYRHNVLYHEPGKYKAEDMPAIVGHAVLFEERVWS